MGRAADVLRLRPGRVHRSERQDVNGRTRRMKVSHDIDDTTVAAGESACFVLYTDVPISSLDHVNVGLGWDDDELEASAGATVARGVQRSVDPDGGLIVSGNLVNVG